jgi:hypothetical protein
MKATISLFIFFVSVTCVAQTIVGKDDVLLKKEDALLGLDNGGLVFNRFAVSGDIYITPNSFIFHPKPSRKKRFRMYNDLVKDVVIPYDSILVARKLWGGLMLKTETKKLIMAGGRNWKAIALKINQLKKEHEAKQAKPPH